MFDCWSFYTTSSKSSPSAGPGFPCSQSHRLQPTASRHVQKSLRRYPRLGAPVPERITRPPNPHLRRAPRFRSAIQQSSARREYQQQEPWRPERQIQRVPMLPSISSFGRRRDEASKYTFPLSQTNQDEGPRGSRHIRMTESETSARPPSMIFPPRRPHRTRRSPKSARDEQYEGHRSASVKSSSYVRADGEYCPGYTSRRSLEDPSHVPPSARRARPARSPPPSTNRWSFSSDSSTSSSSSMCPPTPTSSGADVHWFHSYARDYAQEFEHAQHQAEYWGRQCFEIQAAWATQHPLLFELDNGKPPDLVSPDNHNRQESATDSRPVYEDDDMGQTTVYTNHEVIARDPRFASPLQRIQRLDEALIVQPPTVQESQPLYEDKQKSCSADENAERNKTGLKQNRRTGAFPMWAEPAPREMQDKERDGIRFRFVCDSDESPSVSGARYVTGYEGQPTVNRPNDSRIHSGGSDFYNTRPDGRTPAYSRH